MQHTYTAQLEWRSEQGTTNYQSYSRNHQINASGKVHPLELSSDPSFRGDPSHYNPEELFVASIASCHMLWYLHLCAVNGITVIAYTDAPQGQMTEGKNGGAFDWVKLYPKVTVMEADKTRLAQELHAEAHAKCFIANSVNCAISHYPEVGVL